MSTLQERIAEIMISTGLSVGQIADTTGVSSSAVTQWKDGPTKSLKIGPATKLAQKTGYSAVWISTGDGPKHASNVEGADAPIPLAPRPQPGIAEIILQLGRALELIDEEDREAIASLVKRVVMHPETAHVQSEKIAALLNTQGNREQPRSSRFHN